MPTFALLHAPAVLTVDLHRLQNAPLPLALRQVRSFGAMLEPRWIFGAEPLDQ